MIKRTVAFLMSCVLLISAVPASAQTDPGDTAPNEVYAAIENVVNGISFEKERYGLDGVDLSSAKIGLEIPAYEVKNGALSRMDMRFFPVLDQNDKVVSMAAVVIRNGNAYATLSSELAGGISAGAGEGIALIYDNTGVYLFEGESFRLLEYVGADIAGDAEIISRGDIASVSADMMKVDCAKLQGIKTLAIMERSKPRSISYLCAFLPVNVVSRSNFDSLCWAPCMAGIIEYERGIAFTPRGMAAVFGQNDYAACGIATVQARLANGFAVYYSYHRGSGYYCSITDVLNSLSRDNPMCGIFAHANSSQPMILRGIDAEARIFSAIDPGNPGNESYIAGTYSVSGSLGCFAINDQSGGITLAMTEYLYNY